MSIPRDFGPLVTYILSESQELLMSEVVTPNDLIGWSQDVVDKVLDFYRANRYHPNMESCYDAILKINLKEHKKIRRRIENPRIKNSFLEENFEEKN